VTDNADLVILREAVALVRAQLVHVLRALRAFALEWKALPVLGLTHLQPAQATSLGKRATLWLQDLAFNLQELDEVEARILFRGIKGTTGTQASFLALFQGDHEKVRELERRVARRLGFERCFAVTGQTYPRQLDFRIGAALAGIAQSGAKFGSDLRLLASRREVQEPFGKKQIGSSAMPWKRNPMRAERVCSLARHVLAQLDSLAHTAANQWLERTLDDSAVRRLALPEAFLATDGRPRARPRRRLGPGRAPATDREEPARGAAVPRLRAPDDGGGDERRRPQEAHEHLRQVTHTRGRSDARGAREPLRELLAGRPGAAALRAAPRGVARPGARDRTRRSSGGGVRARGARPLLARFAAVGERARPSRSERRPECRAAASRGGVDAVRSFRVPRCSSPAPWPRYSSAAELPPVLPRPTVPLGLRS
jgi:adenylosuccinate lyase